MDMCYYCKEYHVPGAVCGGIIAAVEQGRYGRLHMKLKTKDAVLGWEMGLKRYIDNEERAGREPDKRKIRYFKRMRNASR